MKVVKEGSEYVCAFGFARDVVEELKAAVPRGYRRWSQERRAWFVHEWYWSEAREVFETYGLLGPDEAAKMAEARKKEAAVAEALKNLYLLPGAPPELVTAAYRALAKLYHPDHGGSDRRMKLINSAYERLRRN